MIINIFSYEEAKKNLDKHKKNWISIRDLGYSYLYKDLDDKGENILELYFDDVTDYNIQHETLHPFYRKVYMKRGLVCFNNEMARDIIKFADNVSNKNEELNIHCWAGRSRSQAVGYVLNTYYNCYLSDNKKDYLFNINNFINRFIGNYDVIRIITEELYKDERVGTSLA